MRLIEASVAARAMLHEAAAAALEAADRAQSLTERLDAMLEALGTTSPVRTPAPGEHVSASPGRISRREREVLALVAEGRSNKEIAANLFVSPNTVKTHVASLLQKLDADSRAHLAAMAMRQQLSLTPH
jgi:DNA-binding NarL/FixJ family response regulator